MSRTAAAIVAVAVLGSCSQFGVHGLALTADDSIRIVSPEDRASATAPLRVTWTDNQARPDGAYVVLIDRAPMPPGEPIRWFAKGDDECAASTKCPDELYLARRGVTVTAATSVDIAIVPPLGKAQSGAFHELTIIRLDANGRREGETAATVLFELSST